MLSEVSHAYFLSVHSFITIIMMVYLSINIVSVKLVNEANPSIFLLTPVKIFYYTVTYKHSNDSNKSIGKHEMAQSLPIMLQCT